MTDRWRILCGEIQFVIDAAVDLTSYPRSDPDPEKEDFAISPRSAVPCAFQRGLTKFPGEPDTPSAQVSSTNFSRSTTCLISCALISCAWRVMPRCLTGICPQCGLLLIIVDVFIFCPFRRF
jgi:hypothetical protein